MGLLEDIKERLSIFVGMYDHIRVVDPVTKRVISQEGEYQLTMPEKVDERCYDFWGRCGVCNSCVSYRAYNEKKSLIKIENKNEGGFFVFALPIDYKGGVYVVELLKKITEQDVYFDQLTRTTLALNSTTLSLNQMVNIDGLTKVFNRRYLEKQLKNDLLYCEFNACNLVVLMIDVDYFKSINDGYGHLEGDRVLKQFVQVVKLGLRKESDWISRYGGEEFVVVLKDVSDEIALEISERIRRSVELHKFEVGGDVVSITCSIGLSISRDGKLNDEELLRHADRNLYKAKNAGRNRVIA